MAQIAGLDISTTTAGWCLLEDGKLGKHEYYDFDKPKDYDLIDLVEQFEEVILPDLRKADIVILEAV
jgi:hypothetical protein